MPDKWKDVSCDCGSCKNACEYSPGWFLPEEIEKVAQFLNMPLEKVFKEYFAVNWFCGDGENIKETVFVIAPVLVDEPAGQEYPGDPRGECIFYTEDERCMIHDVRPFECRKYLHNQKPKDYKPRHVFVAKAWKDKQDIIEKLLGRKPEEAEFKPESIFDMMMF